MTPLIKLGTQSVSPHWRLPGKLSPSRFHSAASHDRIWNHLPRTLVILPVFLLFARISLFMKGRGETAFGYIDAYAVAEIAFSGATILLLCCEAATASVLRLVSRSAVGWLLLYYAFGTLSALWSLMPLYTFFRGIQVLSQFLAVFVILAKARTFAARELTFLAAGVLAIVLEIGGHFRLVGGVPSIAALHTCSYSNMGLMLFVYCLAEYPGCEPSRQRTLWWFGAAGLAAVVLGTSATTNLSVVFGALVAVIVSARRGGGQPVKALALCLLILLGLLAWFAQDSVMAWLMPNKTAAEIESFTGRRNLWEQLGGLFHQNPLLGLGFVASTRTGEVAVHDAHNGLLQALLDTGILGVGILVLALAALGASCLRELRHRSAGSAGFAAVFAALLLVNVTVPIWASGWDKPVLGWAFLTGLHTLAARRRKPLPAASRQPTDWRRVRLPPRLYARRRSG